MKFEICQKISFELTTYMKRRPFRFMFKNFRKPDAVLAVGKSAIAITEQNTLSVLRLALENGKKT